MADNSMGESQDAISSSPFINQEQQSASAGQYEHQNSGQAQLRRNGNLSTEEKKTKRMLKKRLKQQTRLRKYEMRLRQAIGRGDTKTEERARRELREYRQQIQHEQQQIEQPEGTGSIIQGLGTAGPPPGTIFEETERIRNGRRWIGELYESLIHLCFKQQQELPLPGEVGQLNQPQTESTSKGSRRGKKNHVKKNNKEFQTTQARELLVNMSKGTQTEDMFENRDALLGYTRQKFLERAMLPVTSLERLFVQLTTSSSPSCPLIGGVESTTSTTNTKVSDDDLGLTRTTSLTSPSSSTRRLVDSLRSVQTICSIGCGPGCDAVGVMAFLCVLRDSNDAKLGGTKSIAETQHLSRNSEDNEGQAVNSSQQAKLQRLILMDYVMPRWKQLVLDPLVNQLLIPSRFVKHVEMVACDVRRPLLCEKANVAALNSLMVGTIEDEGRRPEPRSNIQALPEHQEEIIQDPVSQPSINDQPSASSDVDLIVVSYVLTETRGQWHTFFRQLVFGNGIDQVDQLGANGAEPPKSSTPSSAPLPVELRSGTLFLMSEPTAWQLHHWLDLVGEKLSDYEWLDSSQFAPELQALENRIGPAVLLARVK